MKGQKLDEAKAGVDHENFGGIPYKEEEYYQYRNWLEPYLMNNPNDAGLSEEELLSKFRKQKMSDEDKFQIPGDIRTGNDELTPEDL